MADTETYAGNVEGYAGWDADDIMIVVGVSILGATALGFWFYSHQIASIGVGLVGAVTAPISAGGNGLAALITAFFQWAGHFVSSGLAIFPWYSYALVKLAMLKVYVSSHMGARISLSVFTRTGYATLLPGV
jgi:hypothetical protein